MSIGLKNIPRLILILSFIIVSLSAQEENGSTTAYDESTQSTRWSAYLPVTALVLAALILSQSDNQENSSSSHHSHNDSYNSSYSHSPFSPRSWSSSSSSSRSSSSSPSTHSSSSSHQ